MSFVVTSRIAAGFGGAYRRESQIVYPPVSVETFYWKEPEEYYLIVSEAAWRPNGHTTRPVCAFFRKRGESCASWETARNIGA